MSDLEPLLTAAEVAKLFRVHEKTVKRWGRENRLPSVIIPSGRRLYPPRETYRLVTANISLK
jgi:excisionase family DNA binding protein